LKLNGTHRLLVYIDDVNILDRSIKTIRKNTNALVVASKETELLANADKLSTWPCLEMRMRDKIII
jgi:choline kinase